MSSRSKEVRSILKVLESPENGCSVRRSGPHWKVKGPTGGCVTISFSPSDHRVILNIKADIRRNLGISL